MNCPACSNRFPVLNANSEDYINSYSIIICPCCSSKLRLVESNRTPVHCASSALPIILSIALTGVLISVSKVTAAVLVTAIVVGVIIKMKKQAVTKRNYSIEFQLEQIAEETPTPTSEPLCDSPIE